MRLPASWLSAAHAVDGAAKRRLVRVDCFDLESKEFVGVYALPDVAGGYSLPLLLAPHAPMCTTLPISSFGLRIEKPLIAALHDNRQVCPPLTEQDAFTVWARLQHRAWVCVTRGAPAPAPPAHVDEPESADEFEREQASDGEYEDADEPLFVEAEATDFFRNALLSGCPLTDTIAGMALWETRDTPFIFMTPTGKSTASSGLDVQAAIDNQRFPVFLMARGLQQPLTVVFTGVNASAPRVVSDYAREWDKAAIAGGRDDEDLIQALRSTGNRVLGLRIRSSSLSAVPFKASQLGARIGYCNEDATTGRVSREKMHHNDKFCIITKFSTLANDYLYPARVDRWSDMMGSVFGPGFQAFVAGRAAEGRDYGDVDTRLWPVITLLVHLGLLPNVRTWSLDRWTKLLTDCKIKPDAPTQNRRTSGERIAAYTLHADTERIDRLRTALEDPDTRVQDAVGVFLGIARSIHASIAGAIIRVVGVARHEHVNDKRVIKLTAPFIESIIRSAEKLAETGASADYILKATPESLMPEMKEMVPMLRAVSARATAFAAEAKAVQDSVTPYANPAVQAYAAAVAAVAPNSEIPPEVGEITQDEPMPHKKGGGRRDRNRRASIHRAARGAPQPEARAAPAPVVLRERELVTDSMPEPDAFDECLSQTWRADAHFGQTTADFPRDDSLPPQAPPMRVPTNAPPAPTKKWLSLELGPEACHITVEKTMMMWRAEQKPFVSSKGLAYMRKAHALGTPPYPVHESHLMEVEPSELEGLPPSLLWEKARSACSLETGEAVPCSELKARTPYMVHEECAAMTAVDSGAKAELFISAQYEGDGGYRKAIICGQSHDVARDYDHFPSFSGSRGEEWAWQEVRMSNYGVFQTLYWCAEDGATPPKLNVPESLARVDKSGGKGRKKGKGKGKEAVVVKKPTKPPKPQPSAPAARTPAPQPSAPAASAPAAPSPPPRSPKPPSAGAPVPTDPLYAREKIVARFRAHFPEEDAKKTAPLASGLAATRLSMIAPGEKGDGDGVAAPWQDVGTPHRVTSDVVGHYLVALSAAVLGSLDLHGEHFFTCTQNKHRSVYLNCFREAKRAAPFLLEGAHDVLTSREHKIAAQPCLAADPRVAQLSEADVAFAAANVSAKPFSLEAGFAIVAAGKSLFNELLDFVAGGFDVPDQRASTLGKSQWRSVGDGTPLAVRNAFDPVPTDIPASGVPTNKGNAGRTNYGPAERLQEVITTRDVLGIHANDSDEEDV